MHRPRFPLSALTAGFSLIEIILALGIISFALVGILGLFPVAVNAAAESQHETQAALIARSIFDELEANPATPKRTLTLGATLIGSPTTSVDLTALDKTYRSIVAFDSDGAALPASDPGAAYEVDLKIDPVVPANGLTQVGLTVRVPLKRTTYTFVTLLRQ